MVNQLTRLLVHEMSEKDCDKMISSLILETETAELLQRVIQSLRRDLPSLDANEEPSWYKQMGEKCPWKDFLKTFLDLTNKYAKQNSRTLDSYFLEE